MSGEFSEARQGENLTILERPDLRSPILVAAFAGWPDAAEAATRAVYFLRQRLQATKLAEIRPDAFLDLTTIRPKVVIHEGLLEEYSVPTNAFFWVHNRRGEHDLILLEGVEPNLRWQSYVDLILDFAQSLYVSKVISLGGLYDQVPHTAPTPISAVVSQPDLRAELLAAGISPSDYQGPSSLHSLLLQECRVRAIPALSLWAHASGYVQVAWNAKATYSLVAHLLPILGLRVDIEELRSASEFLETTLDRLVDEDPDARQHVQRLEDQFEQEHPAPPSPGSGRIFDEIRELLNKPEEPPEEES